MFGAVGTDAGMVELVEVDGRCTFAVQDDVDVRFLGGDRHVVALTGGLPGVEPGGDQVVEGPRVVEASALGVVDGDSRPVFAGSLGRRGE